MIPLMHSAQITCTQFLASSVHVGSEGDHGVVRELLEDLGGDPVLAALPTLQPMAVRSLAGVTRMSGMSKRRSNQSERQCSATAWTLAIFSFGTLKKFSK